MSRKRRSHSHSQEQSWLADQLAKSTFFHGRLHAWGLLEIAQQIEQVRGDQLDWDRLDQLGISRGAWNKVVHSGIKPVLVFAHPEVLQNIARAVSYYRMLAMVSQKSMARIGLLVNDLEGGKLPTSQQAIDIARHLNAIISKLIEADDIIAMRELDLWRGMAAGTQAQGSWQNAKGAEVETLVKEFVRQRAQSIGITNTPAPNRIVLRDGREIIFGDDPDIVISRNEKPLVAIEVKGGIDPAGALERLGAAIKSLQRVKENNHTCVTILLLRQSSVTEGVRRDIKRSHAAVDYWYTIEDFISDEAVQGTLWQQMGF